MHLNFLYDINKLDFYLGDIMKKFNFKQFIFYTGASLIAMLSDLIIFTLCVYVIFSRLEQGVAIFLASIIARVASSFINFMLSRKALNSNVSKRKGIPKFFLLCFVQIITSANIVILICRYTPLSKTLVKCCVDTVLYFVFYRIYSKYIFNKKIKNPSI